MGFCGPLSKSLHSCQPRVRLDGSRPALLQAPSRSVICPHREVQAEATPDKHLKFAGMRPVLCRVDKYDSAWTNSRAQGGRVTYRDFKSGGARVEPTYFKRYAHAASPFNYSISRWPALISAGHSQPTAHRAGGPKSSTFPLPSCAYPRPELI